MKEIKIQKNNSVSKSKLSIRNYIKDVSKIKISAEHDKNKTSDQLVVDNLKFVISVAKQYQGYGVEIEDLISEGNVGLIVASKRFDSSQGVKFISYAVWYIKAYILTLLSKSGKKIKLPDGRIWELNKIKKLKAKLEQELEREPTVEELSEVFGKYSAKEILAMLDSQKTPFSLDEYTNDEETYTLNDKISNEDYDNFILNEKRTDYRSKLLRLIQKLSKRDRDCILTYYEMHPEYTSLEEVGKVYNIGVGRVRQCIESGVRKMRWRAHKEKFDI